jgi:hypothetical protein
MHLCPNFFSYKLLPKLVKITKQLLILTKCHSITTSFEMWMSKVRNDIFALVINFLGVNW